jgi:hypothetical protein
VGGRDGEAVPTGEREHAAGGADERRWLLLRWSAVAAALPLLLMPHLLLLVLPRLLGIVGLAEDPGRGEWRRGVRVRVAKSARRGLRPPRPRCRAPPEERRVRRAASVRMEVRRGRGLAWKWLSPEQHD